jgi:hypothetical protein
MTGANAEDEDLIHDLKDCLITLIRRESAAPDPRAFAQLDDLGMAEGVLSPYVRHRVLAFLAEAAPLLAAAYVGLGQNDRDPTAETLVSLRQGLLHSALDQCRRHVANRIMFRKPLDCQPAIQMRILELQTFLGFSDFLTENARAGRDVALLLAQVAGGIRDECQQLCGGTGYMLETTFAQTVRALDACADALRPMLARVEPPSARFSFWRDTFLASDPWSCGVDRDIAALLLAELDVAC